MQRANVTWLPKAVIRPRRFFWERKGAWRLQQDFTYHDEERGISIRILKYFLFDLASIPRLLWRVLAPWELSLEAALVHDFLYRFGGRLNAWQERGAYTRAQADALFKRIMTQKGIPAWRIALAYPAVRLFGWGAWDKVFAHRHED